MVGGLIGAAVLLGVLPAPGGAGERGTGPADRVATKEAARSLVAEVRAAMAGGKLADVLATAGIAPVAPLAGATAGSDPITELSAQISRAGELIEAAVPADDDLRQARAAMLRALRMRRPAADLLDAPGHRAVDRAAAIVASAIDAALPRLLAMASDGGSSETVDGCDIADQAPALCVAGDGGNVITKDYALVVDLGGADVHENSAGGADVLSNGLPVSVTIDLGGDDTYATQSPTASGSEIAQGGGIGGAGFLVDVAGDDTYRIAADGPFAFSMGQGASLSGVGMLADLAGNDSYELDAVGPGYPTAIGQGDGAHGTGILLDLAGNDRHLIRATATAFFEASPLAVYPPFATAFGLGGGAFGYINIETPDPIHFEASYRGMGFGLFADGGGADELDIEATAPDPPDDKFFGPGLRGLPGAAAAGVGVARDGGIGLAVLDVGATETNVVATTRAQFGAALSAGMGFGLGGGQGILSDLGGDDLRTLRSDVAVARHGCDDCEKDAWARSDLASIRGMGSGWEGGFGLLEDSAGADRYVASATNVIETTFRGQPADGSPGKSVSIAGPVYVVAQGAAERIGAGGELFDAAGNDRYEVTAGSLASAVATRDGEGPPPEATAVAGDSRVLAQASGRLFGAGSLTDLGGSDVYIATSAIEAQADPPTSVQAGTRTAGVLASVDAESGARFVDRDDGLPDTFTASPATPACVGTRGQGAWVDCGGVGAGLVA